MNLDLENRKFRVQLLYTSGFLLLKLSLILFLSAAAAVEIKSIKLNYPEKCSLLFLSF